MARILLVDDEESFRHWAAEALRTRGHEVDESVDGSSAWNQVQKHSYDVVVSDLRMPGKNGLDFLREAAGRIPDCILILLTAYASVDSAVEALRIGVHDFIVKPVNLDILARKIELLLRHQSALSENRLLRGGLDPQAPSSGLVGASDAIQQVQRLIAKVAPTDSTVLITGETGTGKELVARAIHAGSPRSERPFVAINCGSIPPTLLESELFGYVRGSFTGADRDKRGLFEVAGAGTVFLDEIGELPLTLQPKLLRALEDREIFRVGSTEPLRICARIIAATHRNLPDMLSLGEFRADLFYRLNVFEIRISPLRERPQDIFPIAQHLLDRLSRRMNRPRPALEPEAARALEQYPWPGNVRELANILERALILSEGPRIGMIDLPGLDAHSGAPSAGDPPDDLRMARQAFERSHVLRVIEKCNGDRAKAAQALGIDISSLYRKLQGG